MLAISAIPEPAGWAMLLAGFGALGLVMRRHRQTRVRVRVNR
nr:PEPxxWA-CTERM sorting domain-containing protein [Sphingomonas sp. S2M10]